MSDLAPLRNGKPRRAATPAPRALDLETKAAERPADHHDDLRLWLRMLACTNLIETEVRRRLRESFDVTLPRFDLMAQLDKSPGGLALGEVSRRLMVSNGNVTAVVERLMEEGLVARRPSESDRRVQIVSLTASGQAAFRRMARQHEGWIVDLFAGVEPDEAAALMLLLGRLKASVRAAAPEEARPATAPKGGRERAKTPRSRTATRANAPAADKGDRT